MSDVDTVASGEDTDRTDPTLERVSRETGVASLSDKGEQRARILTAKLSLPHQGFVLSRPRLRALARPVLAGGVIYLVAGPGYGKTAFVVDLLSSSVGQPVYYSLDEGDRDPIRFLSYLMAGLGMEAPELHSAVSLGWSERGEGNELVLDMTARLLDFMSTRKGEPALVALDDLHLVDTSAEVVGVLELITRGLPPGWTLLLSSRRQMPFALDSVDLGGRLVQLQSRELRLTPQEVTAWARQNWMIQLEPSDARALWRLTEGWPAALVLLGQHLLSRGGGISRKDIVGVITRGRDLGTYLERHILSGLAPEAAQIMMSAALLTRVTFPRDEAFLPGSSGQAEATLEEFVSRGFLVTRAGRQSYSVHPLVRAFALRQAWQSKEGADLVHRAAQHLDRVGEYHQAASLYLRAGRFQDAAHPIRSLVLSSLNATVNLTRDDWLDLIPSAGGGDELDPWLLVAKARILQNRAEYKAAAGLYERAARLLSASGDKEGLLAVLLGSAFCLYNQGYWEESLAVMTRCRSLASSQREKVEVLVAEGNVLVSLCRWDEAVEDWEKALALAPAPDRRSFAKRIHFHRARLFYSLGHYHLAKQWLDKAMAGKEGPRSPSYAMALNGATILAYLSGDYALATRYAEECMELVRTRGYAWIEVSSMLNQAAVATGGWDYRSAVKKIREAQALAAETGDAEACFWAEDMLGDLCRRNKNAKRALEHHRVALEVVEKSRLAVFEKVRASTAVGMDLAVLGQDDDARVSLEETVRLSRRWGLMSSLSPGLFYLGWLYARQGREHEAARSLKEAMRVAGEHGHVHFFSQEARVAVPILALCDRFECGSFARESIVPRLPARLQTYFRRLTEGRIYPTDVPLGPPGRSLTGTPGVTSVTTDHRQGDATSVGIETLTDREREILKLIALGMPNKLIGNKLFITEKTVKTHANHIYRKLGVASRVQATLVFQSYQRKRRAGGPGGV